ncbi:MAG: hypothetical protein ACI8WB_002561 [Phenylobacterium sp.]|jgi:hypothetical protein
MSDISYKAIGGASLVPVECEVTICRCHGCNDLMVDNPKAAAEAVEDKFIEIQVVEAPADEFEAIEIEVIAAQADEFESIETEVIEPDVIEVEVIELDVIETQSIEARVVESQLEPPLNQASSDVYALQQDALQMLENLKLQEQQKLAQALAQLNPLPTNAPSTEQANAQQAGDTPLQGHFAYQGQNSQSQNIGSTTNLDGMLLNDSLLDPLQGLAKIQQVQESQLDRLMDKIKATLTSSTINSKTTLTKDGDSHD